MGSGAERGAKLTSQLLAFSRRQPRLTAASAAPQSVPLRQGHLSEILRICYEQRGSLHSRSDEYPFDT